MTIVYLQAVLGLICLLLGVYLYKTDSSEVMVGILLFFALCFFASMGKAING